jgi:hypothetical protein
LKKTIGKPGKEIELVFTIPDDPKEITDELADFIYKDA